MTKKFTQKQFADLVRIQEKYFCDSTFYESYISGENDLMKITTPEKAIRIENKKLGDFILDNKLEEEAIALMNTIARPYVKDKLVEKEERYVWMVDDGQTVSLDHGQWLLDNTPQYSDEYKFTQSDIMDSPFNISKLVKKSEEDDENIIEDGLPF